MLSCIDAAREHLPCGISSGEFSPDDMKRSAAGSIEPEIVVHRLHADQPIKCVAAARQLARAIMAAANEIDGLT
jgi:hypothetical protein